MLFISNTRGQSDIMEDKTAVLFRTSEVLIQALDLASVSAKDWPEYVL